jgi:hypothetical protein
MTSLSLQPVPSLQFTVLKITCKFFLLPTETVIVAHPVVRRAAARIASLSVQLALETSSRL